MNSARCADSETGSERTSERGRLRMQHRQRARKTAAPRNAASIARVVARWGLAGLLAVAGSGHLTWGRRGFRITVPDWAPRVLRVDKDAIVVGSGVVELVLAASLVLPSRKRTCVGWAVAAFFLAVFPGNVHQWRTGRSAPMLDTERRRFVRLFLQPVLVVWALWSTRQRHGH